MSTCDDGGCSMRAHRDAQARGWPQGRAMASPRCGWRGTITVIRPWSRSRSRRCTSIRISSSPGWVEARGDQRPAAGQRVEALELGAIGGRRRHVELEIAGHHDARAAERREAFGIAMRLREAEIELAEQRRDGAARMAPAFEGTRRQRGR